MCGVPALGAIDDPPGGSVVVIVSAAHLETLPRSLPSFASGVGCAHYIPVYPQQQQEDN